MRIGIVTGGSKGIGKCLTRALVQHGPDLDELWVVSRSPLQVDLNVCGGVPVRQISLDISGPDSQSGLTALLHESGATVAFLIANAGVAEAFKVPDSVNDLRFSPLLVPWYRPISGEPSVSCTHPFLSWARNPKFSLLVLYLHSCRLRDLVFIHPLKRFSGTGLSHFVRNFGHAAFR